MYDPTRPPPAPGQMGITSMPQTLGGFPAQHQGARAAPVGNPFGGGQLPGSRPAAPPMGAVPTSPIGRPSGGMNALNLPNMSEYFPGGLPGGMNLPSGIGIPAGTQVNPSTLPAAPNAGGLPGNMGNHGWDLQGLMAALRGWIDARPQWREYDGTRQEFRGDLQDWRGQRPDFRSFFGAPAQGIAPGEPTPGA